MRKKGERIKEPLTRKVMDLDLDQTSGYILRFAISCWTERGDLKGKDVGGHLMDA
jgi:hypothetical protein